MTLNGVMAITLRYFTEFGKPVLQKTICGGIYARIYCILVRAQCRRKEFTFAISSPDEFLVFNCINVLLAKFLMWRFLWPVRCNFFVSRLIA